MNRRPNTAAAVARCCYRLGLDLDDFHLLDQVPPMLLVAEPYAGPGGPADPLDGYLGTTGRYSLAGS